MTVGAGVLGRDIIKTMAGQPIAGVQSFGVSIAGEPVDVTDDDSSGFRTLLAQAGTKTLDFSVSGVTKNMELERSWISNESKVYAFVRTYPDGSILTVDCFMAAYNTTEESNTAQTFDATFNSTGEFTFTPGP